MRGAFRCDPFAAEADREKRFPRESGNLCYGCKLGGRLSFYTGGRSSSAAGGAAGSADRARSRAFS